MIYYYFNDEKLALTYNSQAVILREYYVIGNTNFPIHPSSYEKYDNIMPYTST